MYPSLSIFKYLHIIPLCRFNTMNLTNPLWVSILVVTVLSIMNNGIITSFIHLSTNTAVNIYAG